MKSPFVLTMLLSIGLSATAAPASLATEEFMDPGITLFVRNKHPANQTAFSPGKILLFVHGATYPAETSFDLKLNRIVRDGL